MIQRSLSASTVKVLQTFLEDPATDHYGYQIMKTTRLKSGSLYPILRRLEADGWLTVHDEKIDEKAEGRPARRIYRLTALGQQAGRSAVTEFYRSLGPHPSWLPNLGTP